MSNNSRRLRRILRALGIFVMLPYAIVCGAVYSFQGTLLYPASREMSRDPSAENLKFEDVYLDVGGEKTHGWWIPREGARGTVLFSHGNGGNLANWLGLLVLLRDFGVNVFAYDYGGYGTSTGTPGEARLYGDIRAAWKFLTETKGIPAKQIIIHGRSIGGGPTAQLATEVQPGGVVLESTFTSLPDVAATVFWYLPVHLLARDHYATQDKVALFKSPLMVMHSAQDDLIPYAHGQKLFSLAKEPKTFVEMRGGHNDGSWLSKDVYAAAWKKFIADMNWDMAARQ